MPCVCLLVSVSRAAVITKVQIRRKVRHRVAVINEGRTHYAFRRFTGYEIQVEGQPVTICYVQFRYFVMAARHDDEQQGYCKAQERV